MAKKIKSLLSFILKMTKRVRFKIHISFSVNVVLIWLFVSFFNSSCKKLIAINPPSNTITTDQVFSDSADANGAILGIYTSMINTNNPLFASGAITLYGGMSADELTEFFRGLDDDQIYTNSVISNNSSTFSNLWKKAYGIIYQTNAALYGIESSNGIKQSIKDQYIGEAKFIRALSYFYLVNLFGDVPYITVTNYSNSSLSARVSKEVINQYIISDLKDAQANLAADYSISNGERIRANKWAATALLARAYLYNGAWDSAEAQATAIINNYSLFELDSLNGVFLKNSKEAILQWGLNAASSARGNETPEGYSIIPSRATTYPYYYLDTQLLNSFEPGDLRKVAWVNSSKYLGKTYFYPYKYKIGRAQYSTTSTEYYMVLRLAEQYLIRAEARAKQGSNLEGAISDLNKIRERAGLTDLPLSLTQPEVLSAVVQERRIELFAEWGHRWLDLKRTGQIDSVMSIVTPQKIGGGVWKNYQQLYPIPYLDMATDPNLSQNPGY